jgi:FAD/FMN-containing dehydrogenase
MTADKPQKELWEVRKAGLNIMMSLRGDGKPVSFIEDCAVPLEHLAEYTDALTEVFTRHGTRGTWYAHASVGTLHVRPILDMRTRRRAPRCARSPKKPARWCASSRAPSAASTATACAAASGSPGSSARA